MQFFIIKNKCSQKIKCELKYIKNNVISGIQIITIYIYILKKYIKQG